jgi:hypothetical protein
MMFTVPTATPSAPAPAPSATYGYFAGTLYTGPPCTNRMSTREQHMLDAPGIARDKSRWSDAALPRSCAYMALGTCYNVPPAVTNRNGTHKYAFRHR